MGLLHKKSMIEIDEIVQLRDEIVFLFFVFFIPKQKVDQI